MLYQQTITNKRLRIISYISFALYRTSTLGLPSLVCRLGRDRSNPHTHTHGRLMGHQIIDSNYWRSSQLVQDRTNTKAMIHPVDTAESKS